MKETFLDRADNYKVFVCNLCSNICVGNPKENKYYCKPCDNSLDFSEIRIPYAMKLFINECGAMVMNFRLITEKYKEYQRIQKLKIQKI
jgi:DNA-directed RNA polymerase II subunit RPB2